MPAALCAGHSREIAVRAARTIRLPAAG